LFFLIIADALFSRNREKFQKMNFFVDSDSGFGVGFKN